MIRRAFQFFGNSFPLLRHCPTREDQERIEELVEDHVFDLSFSYLAVLGHGASENTKKSLLYIERKGKHVAEAGSFRCGIDERELKVVQNGYFAHVDFRRQFGRKKSEKG